MLYWSGSHLTIEDQQVDLGMRIASAGFVGDVIVVLLDPDSRDGANGVFRNLIGVDTCGNEVWRAKLPTSLTGDCFLDTKEELGQIVAMTWSGYRVRIDPSSGEIVASEFMH